MSWEIEDFIKIDSYTWIAPKYHGPESIFIHKKSIVAIRVLNDKYHPHLKTGIYLGNHGEPKYFCTELNLEELISLINQAE